MHDTHTDPPDDRTESMRRAYREHVETRRELSLSPHLLRINQSRGTGASFAASLRAAEMAEQVARTKR